MVAAISNASINVLFEGSAVGAGYFGTLNIGKHGANRTIRLVGSSLWVYKPSPFSSPFISTSRGSDVNKSLLYPSGATVSPGFTLRLWIGAGPCTVINRR